MAIQLIEFPKRAGNIPLRLARGHFATSHSHLNYYIDLTMTKHRLSEAREAAALLCAKFKHNTIIDTILCLDGTEVIGACMASELTREGYMNMNSHRTISVVTCPGADTPINTSAPASTSAGLPAAFAGLVTFAISSFIGFMPFSRPS